MNREELKASNRGWRERSISKMLIDLAKDLGSVPSTYIRCLTTAFNSSSRGSFSVGTYMHAVYINTQHHIHTSK